MSNQQFNEKTKRWEPATPLPFYRDGRPIHIKVGHLVYLIFVAIFTNKDVEDVEDDLMEKWWIKE